MYIKRNKLSIIPNTSIETLLYGILATEGAFEMLSIANPPGPTPQSEMISPPSPEVFCVLYLNFFGQQDL
jgi:hypothetical protein